MRYTVEEKLQNFKAWSGAVTTLNLLISINRTEEVESYINECMEGATDTDINDFLWFESDFIFNELLGLSEEEN